MKTKLKIILSFVFIIASMFALNLFIEASIVSCVGLALAPFGRISSQKDLRDFSKDFSKFEGKQYYTGNNDEFMDFGGKKKGGNFLQQAVSPLVFLMQITNESTGTETVSLTNGLKSIELISVTVASSGMTGTVSGSVSLTSGVATGITTSTTADGSLSVDIDGSSYTLASLDTEVTAGNITGEQVLDTSGASATVDFSNASLSDMTVSLMSSSITGTGTGTGNLGTFTSTTSDGTVTGTIDGSGFSVAITGSVTATLGYTAGLVRDGDFVGINGGAMSSLSNSTGSIYEFLKFIAHNPTSLNSVKFNSNQYASQMDKQLIVRSVSPFNRLEDRMINLSAYQDQDTYQTKVVTVPTLNVVLGNQTELILDIMPKNGEENHILTVTFFCGAILNTSSALERKQEQAFNTYANNFPNNMDASPVFKTNMATKSMLRG